MKSWCCCKVETKFNNTDFSISSYSKVNFLLTDDKNRILFYTSQKEIYFWARGNGKKNGYIKFCLYFATSSTLHLSKAVTNKNSTILKIIDELLLKVILVPFNKIDIFLFELVLNNLLTIDLNSIIKEFIFNRHFYSIWIKTFTLYLKNIINVYYSRMWIIWHVSIIKFFLT